VLQRRLIFAVELRVTHKQTMR